jgi:large subunit ribosomal protein L6
MSKIGKRPVVILEGVSVENVNGHISVSHNSNKMEMDLPREVSIEIADGQVIVNRINDSKPARAKHGLIARLINNMIEGVKVGFTKELQFTGTGYRAAVSGRDVLLNMGYSHEIKLEIPEGLEVKIVKNSITVSGVDKQAVGQFAAIIRKVRPPEPYKGKGIKYKDEHIRRKAGKTAASK